MIGFSTQKITRPALINYKPTAKKKPSMKDFNLPESQEEWDSMVSKMKSIFSYFKWATCVFHNLRLNKPLKSKFKPHERIIFFC